MLETFSTLDLGGKGDPETSVVKYWPRLAADELCNSSFKKFSLGQRRIQKSLHLQRKAVDVTGARVSESGNEGIYNPVWNLVLHTMLPSMRSAVALATALPRHLPSLKF